MWTHTYVVIHTTLVKLAVPRQILRLTHVQSADSCTPECYKHKTKKWNGMCETSLLDVYSTDLNHFEQPLYSCCVAIHVRAAHSVADARRGMLACEWPLWLDKHAYRNNWLAYFRFFFFIYVKLRSFFIRKYLCFLSFYFILCQCFSDVVF